MLTVDSRNAVMVYDGVLTGGIEHEGRWVELHDDGDVREIPYVNGRKHGTLVVRRTNGSAAEIPYVNGLLHGTRVVSGAPTPSGFQREIGVKTQGSS